MHGLKVERSGLSILKLKEEKRPFTKVGGGKIEFFLTRMSAMNAVCR